MQAIPISGDGKRDAAFVQMFAQERYILSVRLQAFPKNGKAHEIDEWEPKNQDGSEWSLGRINSVLAMHLHGSYICMQTLLTQAFSVMPKIKNCGVLVGAIFKLIH